MNRYLHHLRENAILRTYKKGANLLFQGEIPRRGFVVASGAVRAYTISSSGEEQTVGFYTEGDIAPLSWLMDDTTNTLFYYEALSDVRAWLFTKDDFTSHVLEDKDALQALTRKLATDNVASLLRITGLAQSRADEKIAFILYYLLFRYGKLEKNDVYLIELHLTHATLASLVGLSRESTTKILNSLQSKKVISYERATYSVNKKNLEKYLGEDSFRDLDLR